MSILLASMIHAQLNDKIVKKIIFFNKKFGFFNRKINVFGKKIDFFDEKTAIPCTQPQYMLKFLHRIFPTANQGFPFSIRGCAKPPFHMGIPVWKQGSCFLKILIWKRGFPISIWGCVNPRFHMGIPVRKHPKLQSLFPYGESPYRNTQAD